MPSVEIKKTVLVHKYTGALASLATITLIIIVYARFVQPSNSSFTATIANHKFALKTARTEAEREIGLSNTFELDHSQGMLFEFDGPTQTCFWMKNMHISIDILWFDVNNRLFFEKRNAQPSSYPESFCPPHKAKYVVELISGTSQEFGLKTGDELRLLNQ